MIPAENNDELVDYASDEEVGNNKGSKQNNFGAHYNQPFEDALTF